MTTDSPMPDAARKAATLLPPQQRLEASRASLRVAMHPEPALPPSGPRKSGILDKVGLGASVDGALSHPVVATLRETATHWWTKHPWRPVIVVGLEALNQLAVPVARKHPLRLLAVAMLGGAILSRLKPWKWILVSAGPTLALSMLPTLMSRLAARYLPVSTLIKAFGKPAAVRSGGVARSQARPADDAQAVTTSSAGLR